MSKRAYVEFRVKDTALSPDSITARMGITPSKTWRVGEDSSDPENAGWCLRGPLPETDQLDLQIQALLPILEGRSREILELGEEYLTLLVCVERKPGSSPAFFLPNDLLQRVAALQLHVLYYVADVSSSS